MSSFCKLCCHIGAWQTDRWEQAFEECSEIGFQGIEFTKPHFELLQNQFEEIQEHCKKYNFSMTGIEYHADVIYPDHKDQIIQNALPYLSFLKQLHSNLLILNAGQRCILQEKKLDFHHATETISELAKLCLDHDCYLCVLAQEDTRIMDEEDIDRLMNRVDISEVFLGVDTAHLQRSNCKPDHIIKTYGECLKHVRLQDIYPEGEEPEEGKHYGMLGDGCIPFRPIIRELDQLHYDEWLTITLESPGSDPAEQMEESYQTLQEWIKKKDEPEPVDPFAYGSLTFR